MKAHLAALTALSLALAVPTDAEAVTLAQGIRNPGNFGIGFGGGTATAGLSGKYFTSNATSLQLIVGEAGHGHSDFGSTALGLDFDFLFELPTIANVEEVFELGWAVGLGGWAWIGDPFWLGANGVVALEFNFIPVPIDLVLEYRPALRIIDEVGFDAIEFGGHIRIYFQ